jgi:hypothetical protein
MLLLQQAGRYAEAMRALDDMEGVTASEDLKAQQMLLKMRSFLAKKMMVEKDGGEGL